ncbi:MAG: hypothetical protein M3Y57_01550 [Acidobacteriota bacterium]|nr:hypothetical protein [Acidobacteriota bacterium]
MARGWESKSVESQIEAAEPRPYRRTPQAELTGEQSEAIRERDCLQLSRTRIVNDLEAAENPKYRKMLRQSLQFLDDKLAALEAIANKPIPPG